MKRADSLLRPLIIELGIEDAIRLDEIKRNWNTLFRGPLTFHMTPAALSRGELLIMVDSPAWLQELNFCREDIMKKLDSYGISAIRFRLGRVPTQEKIRARSKDPGGRQLKAEELLYIDEVASGICDSELRDRVKKTMGKALSKKSPSSKH